MKKKWKVILCIALAVVVLGGSLTAWRLCFPPDTHPNAPFRDLSNREKRNVLNAIEKYWEQFSRPGPRRFVWYDKPAPYGEEMNADRLEYYYANRYGFRYYGTFNGYHIIFCGKRSLLHIEGYSASSIVVGGRNFSYQEPFFLFAYRDGIAVLLQDAYQDGLISYEQLRLIHQCYEQYNEDVYTLVGYGGD